MVVMLSGSVFAFDTYISNPVSYFNGSVGIGETTPLAKLHVSTSDSGATPLADYGNLFIEGEGNSGITIGSGETSFGSLAFWSNLISSLTACAPAT